MTPGRPCRLSGASPAADPTEAEGVELSIVIPCLRATPSQAESARRAAFCRPGVTGEILVAGLHGRQCRRQARHLRGRPRRRHQSQHHRGAGAKRHRLRSHRRALQRDHPQGWARREEQFRHLSGSAHQRDARHRGSSCHEQRGAGGMGEPRTSALAPAATNAIFAATGVRSRPAVPVNLASCGFPARGEAWPSGRAAA
jgi:hypothetical protein